MRCGFHHAEAALAARYAADLDRAAADQAYTAAMREVAAAHPDDHDIALLLVEALMDTQPWDYWEADRRTPKGHAVEAIAVTERVLAADPDHPVRGRSISTSTCARPRITPSRPRRPPSGWGR